MPTSGGADRWPDWYKDTLVDPSERMRLQVPQQESAEAAAVTPERLMAREASALRAVAAGRGLRAAAEGGVRPAAGASPG